MEQLSFFDSGRDEEQAEIRWLIDQGFVFVANHSGGKDSQAMYARLAQLVPAHQLIVVHAILHEVDWPGIPEHIEATTWHPVYYVAATKSRTPMETLECLEPQFQMTRSTSRGLS